MNVRLGMREEGLRWARGVHMDPLAVGLMVVGDGGLGGGDWLERVKTPLPVSLFYANSLPCFSIMLG